MRRCRVVLELSALDHLDRPYVCGRYHCGASHADEWYAVIKGATLMGRLNSAILVVVMHMSGDVTESLPDDKLQQILDLLGAIDTRLESIDMRLKVVEAKGLDTKPIWERAIAELVETNRTLDSIDRRLSVLNDDVLQTRADYRKLDDRITTLEHPRT